MRHGFAIDARFEFSGKTARSVGKVDAENTVLVYILRRQTSPELFCGPLTALACGAVDGRYDFST